MHEHAASGLRIALDLHDLGERMLWRRLRRERTQITDAELEAATRASLRERPGAEHGHAVGPHSNQS